MKHLKDIRVLAVLTIATMGFAFEGLRQFQFSNSQNVEEIGKAGEIYSMHGDSTLPMRQQEVRQPKSRPQKLEAMASARGIMFDLKKAVTEYQKEHGLDPKGAAAKKAADAKKKKAKYEYVYDARTGEWIKRKKLTPAQKKILAERRKKQLEQKALAEALEAKSPKKDSFAGAPLEYAPGAAASADANTDLEKDQDFLSYEEWAAKLLHHPNKAELNHFIEAFRSQKVPSDIYARIMEAMLSDPRVEMMEQGLLLANFAPSANSFKALVQFLDDQSLPNSTRTLANKYLAAYSSIQYLNLLEKLLKQSNDSVIIMAATLQLQESIEKYLSPKTPDPDPSVSKNNYASNFSKFEQVLKDLVQSQDTKVVAYAQRALRDLQDSLGRYNVAANQMDSGI